MNFKRHRRLRSTESMRSLIRENHIHKEDLIYPIFLVEGTNIRNPVASMPKVEQISLDLLENEIKEVWNLGIRSIILFGVPNDCDKDNYGSGAYAENGIIQRGIRTVKKSCPEIIVIADTCLCEYTDHGHCGLIEDGEVLNDETLPLLQKTAVSQAKAGADIIAPSNMMDGFVAAIRTALDENGFGHLPIMSYAIKYASAFYGPFRDAAQSAPKFGDRRSYQMDPANRYEAMRELESDLVEGADFIIVKPALSYMDIIRDVRNNCTLPVVAYNVSGEYAMVKAAAQNGWIDEKRLVMEIITSFKRAGADLIITYHAKEICNWLDGK
ncbi:MAG TPA: porphobilinogen synthase [Firmicutes bacterium]|nr:porphobilinogen synthase [Bacillales bacterium]HJA41299.1 porphobilinogen synthase [Bacillota bacterium]